MGIFSSKSNFPWTDLTSEQQLNELLTLSSEKPVVILKHSTRCNISAMVRARLEKNWNPDLEKSIPVYLDLLSYRNLSNKLEDISGVRHESPQVLIFSNGEVVYDASHGSIDAETIEQQISSHL